MRILFVTNYRGAWSQNPSAGIFVERQAESLRAAGIEVLFHDLGRSHSPLALAKKWRELRAEVRRCQPDLIHAQYGTVVSLISALTFHPMVITYGGSDLLVGASVSLPRVYLGIVLSNVAALFAKRIICVSEELRRALWWRRRIVAVIPRGVDLSAFSPGSKSDARRELGWDPSKRIVLIDGGRDPRNKGLDVVEEAMILARRELPDLELFVIHGIPPARMPLLYRAADALVCASRQEGSPNVVKEALACALPVIGVPVGDVPERLAGVSPSAVVERTPVALAQAIVDIVRAPARSNGPDVVAEISMERTAARIIGVYESILPRRSVPVRRGEALP